MRTRVLVGAFAICFAPFGASAVNRIHDSDSGIAPDFPGLPCFPLAACAALPDLACQIPQGRFVAFGMKRMPAHVLTGSTPLALVGAFQRNTA